MVGRGAGISRDTLVLLTHSFRICPALAVHVLFFFYKLWPYATIFEDSEPFKGYFSFSRWLCFSLYVEWGRTPSQHVSLLSSRFPFLRLLYSF
jgi:hypothetical protein